MGRLSAADVTARVDARHWRVVHGRLHATFATGAFDAGVTLVDRVARAAASADHHPDVDLRYARVHVALVSHDAGGLTERDVALAGAISAIADALDVAAVLPFWRAVLAYDDEPPPAPDASPALRDPTGRGPSVWFQQMDAPRPQRNRLHLDVAVPHDVAEHRVRAALEAGGHLVTDAYAPTWWVLADAEGNEVCLTTWRGPGD